MNPVQFEWQSAEAACILSSMIEDRLQKIEEQIGAATNVPAETKAELLSLLASLRSEIAALPSAQEDEARSIDTFAEASAHEATRSAKKPGCSKPP